MTVTDLSVDRIAEAATVIDPVLLRSPQYRDPLLCAELGRDVLTKIETLNPLRSFKGRGAEFLAHSTAPGSTLVCGSSGGNFGQAVAYAATRRGLGAEVFLSARTDEVKRHRTVALGGRVHIVHSGSPKDAAREYADAVAGRVFVEDGRDAAISEGAGTIAGELLATGGFDTVVLPVGDGALVTGVAAWLRAHAPHVRVVGVTPAAAPALAMSWRTGEPTTVAPEDLFAAGITIARPTPEAVHRTRALVHDMVAVSSAELRDAMRLALRTLGVLPEPAGAAGLAAIATRELPGTTFATVLTGANTGADPFVDGPAGPVLGH